VKSVSNSCVLLSGVGTRDDTTVDVGCVDPMNGLIMRIPVGRVQATKDR